MRKNGLKTAVAAAKVMAVVGKFGLAAGLAIPHTAPAFAASLDLPPPYVSRALDAVLIPINHASRHRYQIPPKLHGVYVLAVSPGGAADLQGIKPGDVLATVRDHPILVPSDVDRLVWGALAVSVTDFMFGVSRGADIVQVNTNITVNNFNQNININNINTWNSVETQNNWTQIVNQYNTNISTSITDNSYRSDSFVPKPGQNLDGTNRITQTGTDGLPEPGQEFDGTNRYDQTDTDGLPEPGQNFDGTNRNADDIPEPGQNLSSDDTYDTDDVTDADDGDDNTDDVDDGSDGDDADGTDDADDATDADDGDDNTDDVDDGSDGDDTDDMDNVDDTVDGDDTGDAGDGFDSSDDSSDDEG
ncbi:PDZ domain-containing protein [Paracoccus denitrificans]|uniref:hypothetical protein n=1 Tax=Paracoccus denitrificans TaxID=266 RepID=UPI000CEC3E9E|nr:hypothetical protein [Paracoccus denitrificans]UFS67171.1 hypothetical protein LO749_13655 [Paracoccus denitrificans]